MHAYTQIAEAFRQQNRSLPPWRTPEALLSKWAPAQMEDLRKLMQHVSVRKGLVDDSVHGVHEKKGRCL
eukprot:scaffold207491_cov21-Tisochrysis_lutea.AAC.1